MTSGSEHLSLANTCDFWVLAANKDDVCSHVFLCWSVLSFAFKLEWFLRIVAWQCVVLRPEELLLMSSGIKWHKKLHQKPRQPTKRCCPSWIWRFWTKPMVLWKTLLAKSSLTSRSVLCITFNCVCFHFNGININDHTKLDLKWWIMLFMFRCGWDTRPCGIFRVSVFMEN